MKVLLNAEGNLGYGSDQIDGSMTLGCLLEAVQNAIIDWGEDAEVVLHQTNNGYGANFGRLSQWEVFTGERARCESCDRVIESDDPDRFLCAECVDDEKES